MPESYTVIRGQQYVTEVIAGEEASGKGDVAVVYSGHHVTTKQGTQKSSLKETF
jgi:hypothetical protein